MRETGKRILALRKQKGMTQEELADIAGYASRASIHKIEQETKGAPIDRVAKIAKALGTTQAYLLCLTDDPSPTAMNQSYILSNSWEEYLSLASENSYSELFRTFTAMVDKYGIERINDLVYGYLGMNPTHQRVVDELVKTYYKTDSDEVWDGSLQRQ